MDEPLRCYRHPDRETYVSCAECGRGICPDCMTFGPVGIRCPDHAGVAGRKGSATRSIRRTRSRARFARARSVETPVTFVLIAVNVAVYLAAIAQGNGGLDDPEQSQFFLDGALMGLFVKLNDEWYRLVTATFLHAGILHLFCNMLTLWWLGGVVERSLGALRFLLLYFVSGLAGSAGALLLSGAYDLTVGASGAVFGIMGALLIFEWMQTGSIVGQALGIIVINLAITFAIPNISVGGHLGGLLGGVLATFVLAQTRYRYRRSGLALVMAIGVASVVAAYVRVETYSLNRPESAQPPIATATTPASASAAWAAASRASGTR